MGDEEGVADCKDHLLNIQEEYLQDELDRESVQQLAPSRIAQQEQAKKKVNTHFNTSCSRAIHSFQFVFWQSPYVSILVRGLA